MNGNNKSFTETDIKHHCYSDISLTACDLVVRKIISEETARDRINWFLSLLKRRKISQFEVFRFCKDAETAGTYNALEQVLERWRL